MSAPSMQERDMQYYFAPLEGLTDHIFRQLHHQYFPGVDRYYTPFFSPTIHRSLTPREARELPYAEANGFPLVPQLLTRVPEDFLWMAQVCKDRGYQEVNLNLGCPSGTVTAKGKGAGMLSDPESLDRFLDAIYQNAPLPVSIKTRIGVLSEQELPKLMDIYNQYPICELTIHPRVRKDFYDSPVNMQAFEYALHSSKNPVCYNGNLCTLDQIDAFSAAYPTVKAIMIGRGLIGDPGMLTEGGTTIPALEAFYNALMDHYIETFGGARNAMFRMKENWRFLLHRFDGSEKLGKRLRKTTDLEEFRSITQEIFHTLPLSPALRADW